VDANITVGHNLNAQQFLPRRTETFAEAAAHDLSRSSPDVANQLANLSNHHDFIKFVRNAAQVLITRI